MAFQAKRHKPKASAKKRWDDLRASFLTANKAARDFDIELRIKYGGHNYRTWASRGERSKLEKLENRRNKIGDKLLQLLLNVSPRGEAWLSGAPVYWIYEKLSWDDATRPVNEPLSVTVPAPYGSDRGIT